MTNRTRKCKAIVDGVKCAKKFTAKFEQHHWCCEEHRDLIIAEKLAKVRAKNEAKAKREVKAKAKADRADLRARKEKLKSMQWFYNRAMKSCNAYIRERDKSKDCISCGKPLRFMEVYHAGHYKAQGSHPWIAFNEDNVHGQCEQCNIHLSGNLIEYRKRLIARIGEERVIALEESGKNLGDKSYTRDDLTDIHNKYKQMLKDLKNANATN